ncbi:MAG: MBL fold metallo-hydrolase [Verrucomicrobiota bacterium]|nr:MBL fold metallo-hydrolase [Verrucomicrobiota bacterium]
MELRVLSLPPIGTNAYLLLAPELGKAVLFDAPHTAEERIKPLLEQNHCMLAGVYLTHGHWDHMMDVVRFNEAGVPVFGHEADRALVEDPEMQADYLIPGLGLEPGRIDHAVVDGQELEILGEKVEVRHVPGHSQGSVLYWFPDLGAAFSGDVLFAGGVGRTDFPGCSFEQLETSILEKVFTLPDDTIIYPGHGNRTSVLREKQTNPYVHAS